MSNEYKPPSGSNSESSPDSIQASAGTYADLDLLINQLNKLLVEAREFSFLLDSDLTPLALYSRSDERLIDAHNSEWPVELGDPSSSVSYRFYKHLGRQNTTSALVLRREFERAARNTNNALDFSLLTDAIGEEAILIHDFISTSIDDVSDSSEHRILEIFQDWVGEARQKLGIMRNSYMSTSLGSKSNQQNSLASLQLKLNADNEAVIKKMDQLRANFSEHASTFYEKHLAPGLKFRLKVSKQSASNSVLAQELRGASDALDENFNTIIADQYRRKNLFGQKTTEILDLIQVRDFTRNELILRAQEEGKPYRGGLVQAEETAAQVEYWKAHEDDPPREGSLVASHNVLDELDAEEAHSQYFLLSGDELLGDLELDDDVLVDGMRPSTHAHTGEDGTVQILGSDLLDNTLEDQVVDEEGKPPTPYDLLVLAHRDITLPPGVGIIDTHMRWKGQTRYRYELQLTHILEKIAARYAWIYLDQIALDFTPYQVNDIDVAALDDKYSIVAVDLNDSNSNDSYIGVVLVRRDGDLIEEVDREIFVTEGWDNYKNYAHGVSIAHLTNDKAILAWGVGRDFIGEVVASQNDEYARIVSRSNDLLSMGSIDSVNGSGWSLDLTVMNESVQTVALSDASAIVLIARNFPTAEQKYIIEDYNISGTTLQWQETSSLSIGDPIHNLELGPPVPLDINTLILYEGTASAPTRRLLKRGSPDWYQAQLDTLLADSSPSCFRVNDTTAIEVINVDGALRVRTLTISADTLTEGPSHVLSSIWNGSSSVGAKELHAAQMANPGHLTDAQQAFLLYTDWDQARQLGGTLDSESLTEVAEFTDPVN